MYSRWFESQCSRRQMRWHLFDADYCCGLITRLTQARNNVIARHYGYMHTAANTWDTLSILENAMTAL
jgi:hypothetical protein